MPLGKKLKLSRKSAVVRVVVLLALIMATSLGIHITTVSADEASGRELTDVIDKIQLVHYYDKNNVFLEWQKNETYITINKDLYAGYDYYFLMDWSTEAQTINPGDYFSITFGDIFRDNGSQTGNIYVEGSTTEIIAAYELKFEGNNAILTVTFADYVQGKTNIRGNLLMHFVTQNLDPGDKTILITLPGGVDVSFTGNIEPTPQGTPADPFNAKWGTCDTENYVILDGKKYYYFKWDVWLNADFEVIDNFSIVDTIAQDSPHVFFTPDLVAQISDENISSKYAIEWKNADKLSQITLREYTYADDRYPDTDAVWDQFSYDFGGTHWSRTEKMQEYVVVNDAGYLGIDGNGGISVSDLLRQSKEFSVNLGRVTRPLILSYYTLANIEVAEKALGTREYTIATFTNTVVADGGYSADNVGLQAASVGSTGSGVGEEVVHDFSFTKVDEGGSGLPGAGFGLYSDAAGSDLLDNATSISGGAVSFTDLLSGTYYIKEITAPTGYQLSDTIYKIEINAQGDATITYGENFATVLADNKIANVPIAAAPPPTPAGAKISGGKTLNGKALAADMFTFELRDSNSDLVEAVQNDATGNFEFAELSFDTAGIYTYTVTELNDSQKYITYDSKVYDITITVTEDAGALQAAVQISDGALEFVNTYQEPDAVNAKISGSKTLSGKALAANQFTFQLKDGGGNVVGSVKNDAAGNFELTTPSLATAGVYTYTVTELNDSQQYTTYDSTAHQVTVTVTEENDVLKAEVSPANGTIKFTNTYYVPPAPPTTPTTPPDDDDDGSENETETETTPPAGTEEEGEEDTEQNEETAVGDEEITRDDETEDDPENTGGTEPPGGGSGLPPVILGGGGGDDGGNDLVVVDDEGTPLGRLMPEDDGSYLFVNEEGVPLGRWTQDEEGEWIYDEFPPLGNFLPQTGVNRGLALPAALAGMLLAALGLQKRRAQ